MGPTCILSNKLLGRKEYALDSTGTQLRSVLLAGSNLGPFPNPFPALLLPPQRQSLLKDFCMPVHTHRTGTEHTILFAWTFSPDLPTSCIAHGSCLSITIAEGCHRWDSAYGFIVLLGDCSLGAYLNPCANQLC